ncbi:hypothetical protein GOODEAATRI_005743, partial [Goodea atripinnis]
QQPGDSEHSEEEERDSPLGPPSDYKTRGRLKHSDRTHTWSEQAKRKKDKVGDQQKAKGHEAAGT